MKKALVLILKAFLLTLIWMYRHFLSPLLRPRCRFQPTCSLYAWESVQTHGPLYGSVLVAKRITKCHPWGAYGVDPVPGKTQKKINL